MAFAGTLCFIIFEMKKCIGVILLVLLFEFLFVSIKEIKAQGGDTSITIQYIKLKIDKVTNLTDVLDGDSLKAVDSLLILKNGSNLNYEPLPFTKVECISDSDSVSIYSDFDGYALLLLKQKDKDSIKLIFSFDQRHEKLKDIQLSFLFFENSSEYNNSDHVKISLVDSYEMSQIEYKRYLESVKTLPGRSKK